MKTTLKIFTLTAILFGFATISYAQSNASTATASAGANVISTITLTKNVDLEFGNIVSGAGTVTIPAVASPTRTVTGNIDVYTANRTPTAAKFTVTGETGFKYSIVIPNANIELEHESDASAKMTVGSWALSSTHSTQNNIISADATDNEFYVGGTLTATAGQKVGKYTGSFDVTITYE